MAEEEERRGKDAEPPVVKPRQRRRSPRRLLKGLLYLVVCGLVLAFVIYSPIFTLQRVEVSGNTNLSVEDIESIAQIQKGMPLLSIKTDEVMRHLTSDLRIESAEVRRAMPDTLQIDIKERRPLATAAGDYGYLDLDRQGKVLSVYRTLHQLPIPVITGTTVPGVYIGDDNGNETVTKILYFLQQLDDSALSQLSEVHVETNGDVVIYTNSSVQIRLGPLEDLDVKAKQTQDFLDALPHSLHPIEFVDFRYKAPFIRLKDMPADVEEDKPEKAQ